MISCEIIRSIDLAIPFLTLRQLTVLAQLSTIVRKMSKIIEQIHIKVNNSVMAILIIEETMLLMKE